jgi:c-di-GMP-related signal transduction protein
LNDFIYNDQSYRILPFADIVKIDVLLLSTEELENHVAQLRKYNVTLLAEKVEDINWPYLLKHGISPEYFNEAHQETIAWHQSIPY